jgi:chromosome segregation ATPase
MRQNSRTIFAIVLPVLAVAQFAAAQTASQNASPKGSALPPQQISVQTASAANADASTDTRFGELRKVADQFRVVYEKLDGETMAEIDTLMRSKRCQILRVDGDLTKVIAALDQWNDAELKYWTVWGDAEADRVEGQQKSLASMEAEQKRAEDLVSSTQKDRESLLRDKANLEKFGARTEAIRKQIDSLIQDIKESEARLDEAQKTYDEVTIKVRNMQASINARLIDIRQNKQRVEAYGLEMKSYYEKTRAAANEVCNTAQPKTNTPLPKSKGAPVQQ